MDSNIWTPTQQGGDPAMDGGDWRSTLQPDWRQGIVNKIMETLKRHLPFSGQEGLHELKKIAERFEEKIYTAVTSQSDYLRKISLKMLTMETKSQNGLSNPMPPNGPGNNKPPDPGSLGMPSQVPNQGQLPANQPQAPQQLLSQNFQNNIVSAGGQSSVSLPSAIPPLAGMAQNPIPNVSGQNSNIQNLSAIFSSSLSLSRE